MATRTDEKLELLKRSPFLAGLGRKDLEEVGRLADEVDVKAGHVLMTEGAIGREFFVILSGEIRIDRGGAMVRTMGPGEFVGSIALITEQPRTATATAGTDSPPPVLRPPGVPPLPEDFPSIPASVLESH